jgi:hypothetical protein
MFFFKKSSRRHPKLLQLAEYLDLLEGGLISTDISDATKASAMNLAREVWESLALGAWIAINPTAVIAWRNKSSGHVLVHIPIAGDDCFLIVPLVDEAATPDSYNFVRHRSRVCECDVRLPSVSTRRHRH